jgi:hypothetical protein
MPPKKKHPGNPNSRGRPKTVDREGLGHDGRNAYYREMKKPKEDR